MSPREHLLAKREKPVLSSEGALSTGSTLLNLACTDTAEFGFLKGGYYYLVGDSSSGKAQPLDCKVLTRNGWSRIGDIQIGQKVVDPDGGDAMVVGVYPQGEREVYLIRFSDGATTECCGDHLWAVQRPSERKARKFSVRTTVELKALLSLSQDTWKHYIPIVKPVYLNPKVDRLPIPPYLLGALLGNGCFDKPVRFSCMESEILEEVRKLIPKDTKLAHRVGGDYEIVRAVKKHGPNSLLDSIRKLGLYMKKSHEKFVPEMYSRASQVQRRELLQGLLDTDGYVCKGGSVSYTTCSPFLASQVTEIVQSLGGIATTSITKSPKYRYCYKDIDEVRFGKDSYTLYIRMKNRGDLFRLRRKKERVTCAGFVNRSIESIELIGHKPCQCIEVSSKRHLYITDNYIVTHNTWTSLSCFAEACRSKAFKEYRLIFDDVEGGALMDIAHYFGQAVAKRMESPPRGNSDTIESFYYNLDALNRTGKPFIYVLDSQDSLTSTASEGKFAEQRKAADKGAEQVGSYGDGKAKYHSEHLRQALSGIRRTKSILIIIGQTRDNLGMGFDPKTRSGGRALRFYANLEIWTSVAGKIKKTVRERERTIGAKCLAEVKKNRVTGKVGKDRAVQIPIYYDLGIDDVGSCVDYLISEKHWPKKLKDGKESKIYKTGLGFGFDGTRDQIVRYIEEEDLEDHVRKLTAQVWKEIEEETIPKRKKRYE